MKVDTPETEWLTVDAPELRIVPEELWAAAHARMARTRRAYPGRRDNGQLEGRPEAGLISRHLLSGHLRCGVCGGNMFVAPRSGRGGVKLYYVCTTHHKRGNTRCTNRHGVPYQQVTDVIVSHLRERFLDPFVIANHLRAEAERRKQAPEERRARLVALRSELERLDRELGRLVDAVTAGGQIKALVDRMQATQRQRDDAAAMLEHVEGQQEAEESVDVDTWGEEIRALLTDLAGTLAGAPQNGRRTLAGLLATPITLTPVLNEAGRLTDWDYSGRGTFDQLLSGRLSDGQRPFPSWPWTSSVTNPYTTELVPPG